MNWETIIIMAGKLATETTSKYGPVAWDTMLWLVRIDAIQYLGAGFICLGILIAILYWSIRLIKEGIKEQEERKGVPGILLLVVGGTGFFVGTVVNLLDIWNWVGLFYPELYLAKQLIDKVM